MLTLDLDGIQFSIEINDYSEANLSIDNWTKVNITVTSGDWLNYRLVNKELLLNIEVKNLMGKLDLLLNNQLKSEYALGFAEPDLEFILKPRSNKFGVDIEESATIVISLWDKNNALSANQLHLEMNLEDIRKFTEYLHSL